MSSLPGDITVPGRAEVHEVSPGVYGAGAAGYGRPPREGRPGRILALRYTFRLTAAHSG